MMRILYRAFSNGVPLFVFPAAVLAGAWTQPEHGYYIGFSLSRIDTRQEFNVEGRRASMFSLSPQLRDGRFFSTDLGVYAEYGISEGFTIIGSTQFKSSVSEYTDTAFISRANAGIGDISLFGRLALFEAPFANALQFGWKLPTADSGGPFAVPLGSGHSDFEISGAVGGGIPVQALSNYMQSELGYRWRGGGMSDEIFYSEEFGVSFLESKIAFNVGYSGAIAQKSPQGVNGAIVPGNQTYSRVLFGASMAVSRKVQLFVKMYTVVDGRNTLAGNTFSLGVSLVKPRSTPLKPE